MPNPTLAAGETCLTSPTTMFGELYCVATLPSAMVFILNVQI
jgi:hypothetical protein